MKSFKQYLIEGTNTPEEAAIDAHPRGSLMKTVSRHLGIEPHIRLADILGNHIDKLSRNHRHSDLSHSERLRYAVASVIDSPSGMSIFESLSKPPGRNIPAGPYFDHDNPEDGSPESYNAFRNDFTDHILENHELGVHTPFVGHPWNNG